MSDIPPFTLHRLVSILKARWHIAASIVGVCLLIGIVYLHLAPKTYTVQMQVVEAPDEESASKSSLSAGVALLGQLGAGKSGSGQNKFELYLAGLESIEAARILTQNPQIVRRVFASEWSEDDKRWRRPFSLRGTIIRSIKSVFGIYVPPWQPPDAARMAEFLQGNVVVSRSLISPVVTVSVQTSDPQFGVKLIEALHGSVEGILKRRTLTRVSGYIGYLNGLIQSATVVEYRAALAETIMQQEKVRMVAASGAPYAAEVFARPTPLRYPASPKGVMILALSLIIGIFIAVAEAVLRDRLGAYDRFLDWPGRRSERSQAS